MNNSKKNVAHHLMTLHHIFHRFQFKKSKQMIDSSKGQGRVLSILKMKPEISQKELTYLLDISKQSLAELLGKLEKSEFIVRTPSKEDRRVQMITLTEKGKQVNVGPEETQSDFSSALDCLTDEELANLDLYLSKILNRVKEDFFDENDLLERKKAIEAFLNDYKDDVDKFRVNFKEAFGKDYDRYSRAFIDEYNGDLNAFINAFEDEFKDKELVVKFLKKFKRIQESESEFDFFVKRNNTLGDFEDNK